MGINPIEILLVGDNPGDVRLEIEALKQARIIISPKVVGDGAEAIEYLRKKGKFAQAKKPDLILLDLNLPKKDGREVLAEIKADDDLKRIPVVILTTSKDEEDIFRSYDLHANAYIVKPIDLDQFISAIMKIEDFWLTLVRLPMK